MAIAVGQAAPDFSLQDQYDKEVKISDFAGKKNVVLMFYPLDWSPTCTKEHVCFVNDMKRFETLDAEVLGVSGQPLVTQGLRGKNVQKHTAGGFSRWGHGRQIRRVPRRQRNYRPRGHHRKQRRESSLGKKLRDSGGA